VKIRPDVAELLHAGYSDAAVARQLGVDAKTTVARTRAALGLPKAKPGFRAAATAEDLFWRRARPLDDGHMEWTGTRTNGVPTLRHGGRVHTAYRLAFRIKHGREPVGHVRPGCNVEGCVHPRCMEDQPMRARTREMLAAIFGKSA
jgi:hypothetical protein